MPRIVRTIDDYFSEKKRDLYLLRFVSPKSKECKQARKMIMDWFENNCQNLVIEPIYPIRNDSGYDVIPWDFSHSIDFNEQSLLQFTSEWEEEDGSSKNPFFQCYLIKYEGHDD